MEYTKVSVLSDPQAEEILIAVMLNEGAHGTQVDGGEMPDVSGFDYVCEDELEKVPYAVSAYFLKDEDFASKVENIRLALLQAKNDNPDIAFGSLEISFEDVFEEDWANAWKKYFKPQKVSDFVVVTPSWIEYAAGEDEVVIELDPGMAFGTGTHETTKMCIQMLEEFMEKDSSVLDVGCGSGILSIAAEKLGAKKVLGVDLDPVAVDVAKSNVEKNNSGDVVEILKSDITDAVPEGETYDIVLANIIADIIIRLNDSIAAYMKKPGIYICSGIINERLDDVTSSLEAHGFKIIKIQHMGEWCAVACKYKK